MYFNGFRTYSKNRNTTLLSRFNPTQKKTISNISEFEIDEVKEHLQSFYHNYSFYFEDQVFRKGFYFVKKERWANYWWYSSYTC